MRVHTCALAIVAIFTLIQNVFVKGNDCDKEILSSLAAEANTELDRELSLWFPRAVDRQYGGFHSVLNRDWSVQEYPHKGIIPQSRMVYITSEIAMRLPQYKDEYKEYAVQGGKFLRESMWDRQYGGFFWEVTVSGEPAAEDISEMKHAMGQAFAIFAMANLYRATRDESWLATARQAFEWLDRYGHDADNGGYQEAFYRDGRPMLTAPEDRPEMTLGKAREPLGCKSMNTHMHILIAFTALYEVWPNELLRERLSELRTILRDKIVTWPGAARQFFLPDWTPAVSYDSFGHDLQIAWYLMKAEAALGYDERDKTFSAAKKLVDHAMDYGWDQTCGGFFYNGASFSLPNDRSKFWWTQAEGLNLLLLMHRLYREDRYLSALSDQWRFIRNNLLDKEHGGWFPVTDEDGRNPRGLDRRFDQTTGGLEKCHYWKTAYHEIRALLNLADSGQYLLPDMHE
ncbi:MAG: AGE family epimerase/isomerase [Planctomycetia bacterium]|nr:AGE family epimerase/isomerase [Planctomycetia bacterium]